MLYINSSTIYTDNVIWGMIELGMEVEYSRVVAELDAVDGDKVDLLVKELQDFDMAFSQNFSATVAKACKLTGKPYISWTYDSPLVALYRKEALYDTNYCFMFDKRECERLWSLGINTVYHMPLAANIQRVKTVQGLHSLKYNYDISFVGQIYTSPLYDVIKQGAPEFMIKHVDDVINRLCCRYDGESFFNTLYDNEVEAIYQIIDQTGFDEHSFDKRFVIEDLLFATSIAGRDRITILNESAKHFKTKLITRESEKYKDLIKADISGPVDTDDMYRIFASSKINLNMTLRSIETGIPQRVMDIMSVGGFVLSNYQQEMDELFAIDKELVTFKNLEEYVDKAGYYLTHDDIRRDIARRGYERVCRDYNYKTLLTKMINTVYKG